MPNDPNLRPETDVTPKLRVSSVTFHYGDTAALRDVSVPFFEGHVTALIGPSGCGKSTLLRVFNRMHDLYPNQHVKGQVFLDGENILGPGINVDLLRMRIGMVFQIPAPFPMSIYDNVAFGLRTNWTLARKDLDIYVERALRHAALWDEVKDILSTSALSLSGGQQQRLCLARSIAVFPEVLLLDEPCSSLDPQSTEQIEELIRELKKRHTIIIVTHNLSQAARISDHTAFMYLGELVEFDTTARIFARPKDERTQHYVAGRFG